MCKLNAVHSRATSLCFVSRPSLIFEGKEEKAEKERKPKQKTKDGPPRKVFVLDWFLPGWTLLHSVSMPGCQPASLEVHYKWN